ncbi:[4Fe-4S] cluster carrier protein NfuA [uncultured Gammaproteobacteria bacterium]|jgi:Fe/S biogenesis protein NfuA|nr:[4Fe-4S] cluster carrier protein NfuA [Bathymodiolus brooksi thiotrophic gill symbiont]CAC9568788.1 [4Fe-4S] cluster carrier protein NfuA [uncultured Gammaproteobacteria bacterium]CAC9961878.1 [4Fe-4S] cluster carrier protein NfuA [uncultured Gammaproteobacteria bacterium]CAC9977565.1 [4Fe-4S] cluster carrier protein NfuA [uncultured Gammaproteobacteria bacterium]
MFNITDEAEIYVADLFAQQGEEDLGLKVDIEKSGTPAAAVTFNFCYSKDLSKAYSKFEYKGFVAFIDEANFDYLKDSEVALKEEGSSKKLTITAPNAKGEAPKDDAPLEEKIKYTIAAEVNPQLASHGGFVDLVEITKDMDVILNFGGGCQGCSSVKITLKNGVEAQLKALYPEIKNILDVTDHTQKENAYM